jgi:hypothetical protein
MTPSELPESLERRTRKGLKLPGIMGAEPESDSDPKPASDLEQLGVPGDFLF